MHGRKISDYVTLKPIDPWYRFVFDDGTKFDYVSSLDKTIKNISEINTCDAKNYTKMLEASERIYNLAFTKLADKPFHNVFFTVVFNLILIPTSSISLARALTSCPVPPIAKYTPCFLSRKCIRE